MQKKSDKMVPDRHVMMELCLPFPFTIHCQANFLFLRASVSPEISWNIGLWKETNASYWYMKTMALIFFPLLFGHPIWSGQKAFYSYWFQIHGDEFHKSVYGIIRTILKAMMKIELQNQNDKKYVPNKETIHCPYQRTRKFSWIHP